MRAANSPMKTVDRNEFREQFEQLLYQVTHDDLELTIEENGQPVAVLRPIDERERREARRRFLDRIEEMQQRANLSAEEADELAREAVEAVRRRSS